MAEQGAPGGNGARGPEHRREAKQGQRVVERSRGGGGRRGEGGGDGEAAGRSRASPEQGRVEEEASAGSRTRRFGGERGVDPAT